MKKWDKKTLGRINRKVQGMQAQERLNCFFFEFTDPSPTSVKVQNKTKTPLVEFITKQQQKKQ